MTPLRLATQGHIRPNWQRALTLAVQGFTWGGPWHPIVVDVDGKGRDRDAEDYERSRVASREALRTAIERAFRRANGEPDPDELSVEVEDALLAEGLRARTAEIERMIAMIREERDDEEAAVMLLLMN